MAEPHLRSTGRGNVLMVKRVDSVAGWRTMMVPFIGRLLNFLKVDV